MIATGIYSMEMIITDRDTQDTPVSCFVSDADSLTVNSARCACLPASSLMDNGRCYAAYNQGQKLIQCVYHNDLLLECIVKQSI